MSLPTDNSVQLSGSSFSSGPPSFDNVNEWTKTNGSNLYNTSLANVGIGTTTTTTYKLNVAGSLNTTSLYQSGTLINFSSYATNTALSTGLATKQDTLTPLTNLLGIGSGITALDYNKITLNKPTNFQADWNSTVINKPATFPADMTNIYNKTQTNTLITITSNYSLNISNILQSNINANNTNTNTLIFNSSNYAINISNILKANIDTNNTNNSNYASNITLLSRFNTSNYASNITLLASNNLRDLINTNLTNSSNYASNISNVIITNSSNFTLGTANNLINLINTNLTNSSNYASNISNVIITNINTNYLKLSGGSLTGSLNISNIGTRLTFGSRLEPFLIKLWGDVYGIGMDIGAIRYSVDTSASHKFYSGTTNTLTINNSGLLTTSGNIDCGGGIALTGSTAFSGGGDPANKVNTYINFKPAGATGDFCYLRQIGAPDAIKLSLDFHDDFNDARFCIRRIISWIDPDDVVEVFTVENGNVSCTGNITTTTGTITGATINASTNLQENNVNLSDKYLKLSGGTMTGALTTGNITILGTTGRLNVIDDYHYIEFSQSSDTTTIQEFGTIKFNIGFSKATKAYINGDGLTATAFFGNGAGITSLDYNKITLNKPTNFQADWNSTIINKPSTFAVDMTNIYTKTEVNGLTTLTNFYNKTSTDTLLNAKEAVLTFSSPLTRTTNTIGINLSAYSTTGTDTNYLLKTGGNITGNVGIGNTAPFYPLCIGSVNAISDGILVLTKRDGGGGTRNFKMGYDANFNFQLGDFGYLNDNTNAWSNQLTISYFNGNIGIGTANQSYKLYVNGNTYINSGLTITGELKNQYWKLTNQSDYCRLYNIAGTDYFNFAAKQLYANQDLVVVTSASIGTNLNCGSLSIGSLDIKYSLFNNSGYTHASITDFNSITEYGFRYVYSPATGSPNSSYTGWYSWYMGLGSEYNNSYGAQVAFARNIEHPRLAIRYKEGGAWGGWTGIYASKASIADTLAAGNQSVYGNFTVNGTLTCTMQSVGNSGNDFVTVQVNTSQGSYYTYPLCIAYGTFTGFHRVFTEDELYNNEEPQKFKDDYVGRIVISSGKIATDTRYNLEEEWQIKYDKEGITIEDALPMVELSRKKKDKRVFGVMGLATRSNSRPERQIINSVGEGALWVANSNGNIENGDYITSSDYLGYGEKQDDDLLHNYTVAKATMDCNFELDSPLYQCLELENGIRVAFIAATYHCG